MGTKEAEREGGMEEEQEIMIERETERETQREVRVGKVDFKSLLNTSPLPHGRPGLFVALIGQYWGVLSVSSQGGGRPLCALMALLASHFTSILVSEAQVMPLKQGNHLPPD